MRRLRKIRAPRGYLRAISALALPALLAATLAAVAGADPVEDLLAEQEAEKQLDLGERANEQDVDADTDHTPVAKESGLWRQVGGAKWPGDSPQIKLVEDSPTTIDVDLYDVAFKSTKFGFAGGAACPEPVVPRADEQRAELAKRADECPDSNGAPRRKVPVIYRFTDTAQHGQLWEEVYRGKAEGEDAAQPGYVGAIAFTPKGLVVAVGGTGKYPKRELSREDPANASGKTECAGGRPKPQNVLCYEDWVADDADTSDGDGAGLGRAWKYANGRFEEIDLTRQRQSGEVETQKYGAEETKAVDARGQCKSAMNTSLFGVVPKPNTVLPPETCDSLGGSLSSPVKVPRPGILGMSALDFHPAPNEDVGAAGALGQILMWKDGGFVKRMTDRYTRIPGIIPGSNPPKNIPPDPESQTLMHNRKRFLYRVREIRFLPQEKPQAFAVTAGCCAEDEAHNTPSLLAYFDGGEGGGGIYWKVRNPGLDPTAPFPISDTTDADEEGGEADALRANLGPGRPDSYYSLIARKGIGRYSITTLATPGGPERPGYERPSVLPPLQCEDGYGGHTSTVGLPSEFAPLNDLTRTNLGTARLVGGDGDSGGSIRAFASSQIRPDTLSAKGLRDLTSQRASSFNGPGDDDDCRPKFPQIGDGYADWLVGELRSTRIEGVGARGLAFATNLPPGLMGETLNVDIDPSNLADPGNWVRRPTTADLVSGSYEPTTQDKLKAWRRSAYLLLPSFSVNAIDMVGLPGSEVGVGWAVGERGAILNLDARAATEAATRAAEPEPPALKSRQTRRLVDRSPYEPFRPQGRGQMGQVPGLAARPRLSLEEGRLFPHGSPDPNRQGENGRASSTATYTEDVSQVVMSRDGSEGWAIGSSANADFRSNLTLFHYDGQSWSRCDPYGIEGALGPDPACLGVAPLRRFTKADQSIGKANLMVAARIPYENDDDPSNDDRFEVLAIGTAYQGEHDPTETPAVARYSEGHWRIEPYAARAALAGATPISLAFATPEEGYLVSGGDGRGGVGSSKLWRYKDRSWSAHSAEGRLAGVDTPDWKVVGAHPAGLTTVGKRVYLFGRRTRNDGPQPETACRFPLLLYKDPGKDWTDGSAESEDKSGWDPGQGGPCAGSEQDQGEIATLAVVRRPDEHYEGWATGSFDASGPGVGLGGTQPTKYSLARLTPGGRWAPFKDAGSAGPFGRASIAILASAQESSPAFIAPRDGGSLHRFESGRRRWSILPSHLEQSGEAAEVGFAARALAPDGEGGFWAASGPAKAGPASVTNFSHYTAAPPEPVFEEVSNPLRSGARASAMAGAADGSLWVATDSDLMAHYDRLTGWETLRIPGWDPGRTVTRPSRVNAIALNPDGSGLAVGEGGRIADLTRDSVRLNPAAGVLCKLPVPAPPCGTGRDLTAVAVSPEGAALAGGERLALLWRPVGEEFRAIAPPEAAEGARISAASMPSQSRAYLATNNGLVFRGDLGAEGGWRWTLESLSGEGEQAVSLTTDWLGQSLPIAALAVDASGHGYAVGQEGLILERTGDGPTPWRRLRDRFRDDLTAVALPAGEGDGALIGGERGLILTRAGDGFVPAHFASRTTGPRPIVGLALLPGVAEGQVEAWAIDDGVTPSAGLGDGIENAVRLLHHASDPSELLLDPVARGARAIPDAPAPRPGELTLAAFGKTECHKSVNIPCRAMARRNDGYEALLAHTVEAIGARSRRPGGPRFALFTGDATDSPLNWVDGNDQGPELGFNRGLSRPPIKLRRFTEYVYDQLADEGLPSFAAVGALDLTETRVQYDPGFDSNGAVTTKEQPKLGDNFPWRWAFEGMPSPWGAGPAAQSRDGALSFEPLRDRRMAQRLRSVGVNDPDDERSLIHQELPQVGDATNIRRVPIGGASTHYALDVVANSRGEERKAARLVVIDSSWRSISAGDGVQQPIEADGGQKAFLEEALCVKGSAGEVAGRCTREPGQAAIVLTNTPTYSYGHGAGIETAPDSSQLEQVLLAHRASVVVSGRLGFNGLYWATAPGVHEPCPGQPYRADPPTPGTRVCDHGAEALPVNPASFVRESEGLANTLSATAPPPPPALAEAANPSGATGVLPFVIAAAAGGKFGTDDHAPEGSAAEGFWHGYVVVRVDRSGDPAQTIVEQRPLVDWLSLTAQARVLRPGQRMTLRGTAREPVVALGSSNSIFVTRFNALDSPAITHRYDLVQADPARPWTPRRDADGAYVPLDPRVATVDGQSGRLKAGKGGQERSYAIALLSVGDHVATMPLVFEPGKSFRPKPAVAIPLPLPPRAPAPAPPSIRVLGQPPVPPPATPPPPAQLPNLAELNLPSPPAPPPLPPTLNLNPVVPPAPPAPPAPPVNPPAQPLALNALLGQVGINAAPIPPNAPAVNPAPPSGSAARKEAKQRQAATAKSEEGANDPSEAQAPVNPVDGPSAPSTRLDQGKGPLAFTAVERPEQPSAWSRGALYGGGLTLMALALALSWGAGGPRARRRGPELPAPARAQAWRGRS